MNAKIHDPAGAGGPVAALIVAGGSGARMGAQTPKQYLEIGGKAIIRHTLEVFAAHPRVDMIQVVIGEGHGEMFARAAEGLETPPPVPGGPSRQLSVLRGLEALAARGAGAPSVVMIHDAARPFVPARLIDRLLEALPGRDGVIPALPVTDTIKRVDAAGRIAGTLPRESLRAAQTPQTFRFPAILAAHRAARDAGESALTDDAAAAERAGLSLIVVEGAPENRKITTAHDLEWAREKTERSR